MAIKSEVRFLRAGVSQLAAMTATLIFVGHFIVSTKSHLADDSCTEALYLAINPRISGPNLKVVSGLPIQPVDATLLGLPLRSENVFESKE